MKQKHLHNIKDTGFKMPKGYFDTLEDKVINKMNFKSKIYQSGFKAPDDYFDSLEDTILNKINEDRKPKVISLFSKKTVLYTSSIAAAVLLMFSLSIFNKKPTFDDLNNQTVENYVFETIYSYEIASLLDEDALTKEILIDIELDEATVEDYILDNLDVEDLY